MSLLRQTVLASLVVALFSVLGACADSDDAETALDRRAGYVATDPCSTHQGADACAGAAEACRWFALTAECPDGADCPSGFCAADDACREHRSEQGCLADAANGCGWAHTRRFCHGDADCDPGPGLCLSEQFTARGCACMCSLFCPAGEDCPACECDCAVRQQMGMNSGGTCACDCPPCGEGTTCGPCQCACEQTTAAGEGGCVEDGTCTCLCESCGDPPCAECECACNQWEEPGPHGKGSAATCTCPPCADPENCPPCSCGSAQPSECDGRGTPSECNAGMGCRWLRMEHMCQGDGPCRVGTCVAEADAPQGCVCACGECQAGEPCLECGCDCSQGQGMGCRPQ